MFGGRYRACPASFNLGFCPARFKLIHTHLEDQLLRPRRSSSHCLQSFCDLWSRGLNLICRYQALLYACMLGTAVPLAKCSVGHGQLSLKQHVACRNSYLRARTDTKGHSPHPEHRGRGATSCCAQLCWRSCSWQMSALMPAWPRLRQIPSLPASTQH